MPAPQVSHPSTSMMAMSLEETVKTTIYKKYIEADSALQKINLELRIKRPGKELGVPSGVAEFISAVLAEYRLIRPKLVYIKKIIPNEKDKQKEFEDLKANLDLMNDTHDQNWPKLVKAHLLIGEFLELDGVTKFEREVPNLTSIMVQ